MKYITLSLLSVLIIFSSCRNEDDIFTEEISPEPTEVESRIIEGKVSESFSVYASLTTKGQNLPNATVKMMYDDIELDRENTDAEGRFAFEEQPVPEDAYLIIDAPGFYKNVRNIRTLTPNVLPFIITLIRQNFEGLSGDDIDDLSPYINLYGGSAGFRDLQNIYFITNANSELIGADNKLFEGGHLEITTKANEPLILHYHTECSDQKIEIGPFSEDTNIRDILEEFTIDISRPEGVIINAFDCEGGTLSNEDHITFSKVNGLTKWGSSVFHLSKIYTDQCLIDTDPVVLISSVTKDPRMYGETSYNYLSGEEQVDIDLCEEDDSFINYSIGGEIEVVPDLFTYANILPDGSMILKQRESIEYEGRNITFQINDSFEGANTTGGVIFNNVIQGDGSVELEGRQIAVNINMNDGKFIEGTFDGPVIDAFESSLGNLRGTFRARIQ
ncbi:carboxypeptidase-like regulatory domain-containing protein [Saprospiraceae bacterium]|nr:carboxypeptidase-like regulatory domain-containing protein [Saprospiraceae bacterium]